MAWLRVLTLVAAAAAAAQLAPAVAASAAAPLVLHAPVGGAAEGDGACPAEPLRQIGAGEYAQLQGNSRTSCGGACPYVAPFPDYPCLVSCVASPEACAKANPQMPAVDPFTDPYLCVSCGITACQSCRFIAAGASVCTACFPGFVGVGGEAGAYTGCELWNQRSVLMIFGVITGILGLILMTVIFVTGVGMCRMTWLFSVQKRQKSRSVIFADAALVLKKNTEEHPLDARVQEAVDSQNRNKIAINRGLQMSLMSSIKYSQKRKRAASSMVSDMNCHLSPKSSLKQLVSKGLHFVIGTVHDCFDSSRDTTMADLGLGLQLFFNTQRFLVIVSFVIFVVTHYTYDPNLGASLVHVDSCVVKHGNVTSRYSADLHIFEAHARQMRFLVVPLWMYLVLHSWYFHYQQKNFMEAYDKRTASAEDYTLKLVGLPEHVTSEKALKALLEQEFQMQGRVHGAVICYNVLEMKERFEEMLEHVVEYDTIRNKWIEERYSTPLPELEEKLSEDKAFLEDALSSGKLRGSGTAFVIMKKQEDMVRILVERAGISKHVFNPNHGKVGHVRPSEIETVNIVKDSVEPAGLRYLDFMTPPKVMAKREYMYLPARMLVYISMYAVAAHVFYMTMIRPYQDNLIEGGESTASVKVISQSVVVFNFLVQTVVMLDVEFAGFVRSTTVDKVTLGWNVLLMLITNAYIVAQECLREGIRWELVPPVSAQSDVSWWGWQRLTFQSVRVEMEVGKNLVGVMLDQIMMLYVLGEVSNVLGPIVGYFFSIRFLYVWGLEGAHTGRAGELLQKIREPMMKFLKLDKASRRHINIREAERVQFMGPLLMWLEYTYIVIFPAMAFITFYLLTDQSSTVCGYLFGFSVLFYVWQRYGMLWLYGKSSFDSAEVYWAFMRLWGVVISMLLPALVWWTWRLGDIVEYPFAVLTMFLVYMLALLVYQLGLIGLDWQYGVRDDFMDDFGEAGDPGYGGVMQEHGCSWWNVNPVYVLKNRHCPKLPGHEVQDDGERYWPEGQDKEGFFEMGKEFKHEPMDNRSLRIRQGGTPGQSSPSRPPRTESGLFGAGGSSPSSVGTPGSAASPASVGSGSLMQPLLPGQRPPASISVVSGTRVVVQQGGIPARSLGASGRPQGSGSSVQHMPAPGSYGAPPAVRTVYTSGSRGVLSVSPQQNGGMRMMTAHPANAMRPPTMLPAVAAQGVASAGSIIGTVQARSPAGRSVL